MKWQPIETAPKDEYVMLFVPKRSSAYPENPRVYLGAMWGGSWATEHASGGGVLQEDQQPTHWMPLPKPPIEGRGER